MPCKTEYKLPPPYNNYGNAGEGGSCHLECLKNLDKLPRVQEFIGPVKIVLVDTPAHVYRYRCWLAALLNFSYFCMGAVTITIVYYSMSYLDYCLKLMHIFLGTMGFQLVFPSGVLIMNPLDGAAVIMKIRDRKCEHVFTMIVGILYAVGATVCSILENILGTFPPLRTFLNFHVISGVAAIFFIILSTVTGPLALFGKTNACTRCLAASHLFLGVLSLFCMSSCFISGIWYASVRLWWPQRHMSEILTFLVVLHTVIICVSPIMRWSEEKMQEQAKKLSSVTIC